MRLHGEAVQKRSKRQKLFGRKDQTLAESSAIGKGTDQVRKERRAEHEGPEQQAGAKRANFALASPEQTGRKGQLEKTE